MFALQGMDWKIQLHRDVATSAPLRFKHILNREIGIFHLILKSSTVTLERYVQLLRKMIDQIPADVFLVLTYKIISIGNESTYIIPHENFGLKIKTFHDGQAIPRYRREHRSPDRAQLAETGKLIVVLFQHFEFQVEGVIHRFSTISIFFKGDLTLSCSVF